jgi:23S rRNA (uracil1939-C5)-methyltransferase
VPLSFRLAPWDVTLAFRPLDFIQVNAKLNEKMIAHALDLLDREDERVLDLFCGLGNFTLPLARVREGGRRGRRCRAGGAWRENAERNGLANAQFFSADLTQDQRSTPWMRRLRQAAAGPAALGRDRSAAAAAAEAVQAHRLRQLPPGLAGARCRLSGQRTGLHPVSAGAMDMFPHTAHVESIAVFEKR